MKSSKVLKALIVEDDLVARMLCEKELVLMSITTKAVGNGSEAIEALKSKDFDFVLLDISMPVQDGIDTIRWIRDIKDPYHQNLPVFALTTFSTSDHTQEIIDAGMNGHLVKPLQVEELIFLLKSKSLL